MFTFGSMGAANGQFNEPSDVVINEDGEILVANTENDRIQIFD